MAKRISFIPTFTPIATADTSNDLVDLSYALAFTGASTTQRTAFWEVVMSGQVQGSSSPMEIPLSYDTVVAATLGSSTITTNPLDPATAALAAPVVVGNAFSTKPRRLAAGKMLDCSINGYGGKFKWTAYDLSFCPLMLGNSSGTGGADISVRAGTVGVLTGHVMVETA